jgi:hypothetical protein
MRAAVWNLGQPPRTADDLSQYRLTFRRQQPLRELDRKFADPRIQSAFYGWGQSERLEYLYRYTNRAAIDPSCGFIIAERLGPLLPSLMESDFAPTPSETMHLERLPSRFRYFSAKSRVGENVIHLPSAVSLRALSEGNYWHFYHDVLSKLRLLEECKIRPDIPLVVAASLYNMPYFQSAMRRPGLVDRQFVVQDSKTYIAADEIVFGTAMGYDKQNFEYVRRLLTPPEPDPNADRRIFLVRGRARSRRLVNLEEIKAVSDRYGFEAVDTDNMSLEEQMALFASTRYVVGIHGAGLVNLMYRAGAPLGLIELFSPRHIAPHYYWLAVDYGYEYYALAGEEVPEGNLDRSFSIDPAQLEGKIRQMVSS